MRLRRAPLLALLVIVTLSALSACGDAHPKAHNTPTPMPTPLPKGWNVMPSPRVGEEGNLGAVAMISTTNAWAVGDYQGTDALQRTLTEHWDGSQWSVVPSPSPSQYSNTLASVAGASGGDVWAVGGMTVPLGGALKYGGESQLIEHWDGKAWKTVPNPSIIQEQSGLSGVVALSARDAWAVGYTEQAIPTGGEEQEPLIEHWDGVSWQVVASPTVVDPNGGGSYFHGLVSVAAVSSNDVWAVGHTQQGSLIEHWDGATWTIVPSADPEGDAGGLVSVSAVASNDVWATGSGLVAGANTGCGNGIGVLMKHWDGSSWTNVATPIPTSIYPSGFSFNAVAAVSAHDVWAVGGAPIGYAGERTFMGTVAEHWDGSQWSIVPSLSGSTSRGFAAIAAHGGVALAIGQAAISNGDGATVIGKWDGSAWSQMTSPSPGTLLNQLNGVAAIGAKDVWAVGSSAAGTLSEHWDGTAWSVVPTVNDSATDNVLNAVAGTSSHDVWAVGAHSSVYSGTGTIEHWDGSAWRSVAADSKGYGTFYGVAALTPQNAWAVGDGIQHWDGATWSVSPYKAPEYSGGQFLGVSAAAQNDVWAVGGNRGGSCSGMSPALIAHWNGTNWSTIPNTPLGVLYSVSAVSSTDAWAVGSLLMHWDGTQWTEVKDSVLQNAYLSAVCARASNDVWVVGTQVSPARLAQQPFIAHWDGSHWTQAQVKGPGLTQNTLTDVAAVSAGEVWAVGSYSQQYNRTQALIEHYLA